MKKSKLHLRELVVLLAFLAVAPGICAVLYSAFVTQNDEVARARTELRSVNRLVAANQEQWVEGVRQILNTMASGPSLRRTDLNNLCVEFLRNIQRSSPSYTNLGILDLQGNVECQALPPLVTMNGRDRLYFRTAVDTRQFSVGEYVRGFQTGRKILGFGMPVLDYNGAMRGVAFATLDLEVANRQLKSIALPPQLHILVSDAHGHVVVSSHRPEELVGAMIPDPVLLAAVLRGANGILENPSADDDWLRSVQSISVGGKDGLLVTVSERKADAIAAANARLRTQLIIMAVASLIGFLMAWLFARRWLEQPIAQLVDRMERVEHGNETLPYTQPEGAEFAALDAAFSSMLAKLQTNQQQLLKAQEITRVGLYQLDLETGLYTASPIVYHILGLDPAHGPVSIALYQSLLHPDDRELVSQHRNRLFAGGKPLRLQYRVIRPDGEIRWLDGFGFVERDDAGKPVLYSGAVQDITDRMHSERVAKINENRFQLLFQNSLDGILQTSPDGTILGANEAACQMFGLTEAQIRQRGREGIVDMTDPRLPALLQERAENGRASGQLTMIRGDGSRFEAELTSTVYVDAEGIQVSSIVMRDITDRIKAEQDIHQLAFYDALTELPNRRLLLDRLSALLSSAQRSGEICAVLYIDLDHFKNVNDARGHAVGDAMLRQVAQRLSALVRMEDTVARIGGDEFVILIPSLAAEFALAAQHAMIVAEKIREMLTRPFHIDGQQYGSGASIGVTMLPKDGQTTEDLLREADTAMYRAKTAGRNRIAFFETAMQREAEARLALESDLSQAVGTVQLAMMLQPQFDHDGQPVGGELLMRWTHPLRGVVSPALFIPIAEESGLILQLGDWVVREGCNALLQLQRVGRLMPVSINVSPRQFRQPDFVERVRTILVETGAPAAHLIFEVTEGLLIDNLDETILRMKELVGIGIRFSIDDFGTGYSSLAYLRRLPLHELKIDRSFVQDTPNDPGATAIVQSILAMAGHLDLQVVAEGVETEQQADFLRTAGCTALQGYLLARPMPLETWLQRESAAIG